MSDFKQELLFSAGVEAERIIEFSCGEYPKILHPGIDLGGLGVVS